MTDYTYYSDIKRSKNFTDLNDSDPNDDLTYPKTTDTNGYYTVTYEMPVNATVLTGTGYYTAADQEYIYFRPLEQTQQAAVEKILHDDTSYDYSYSVFYSDVAKVNFDNSAIYNADIVLFQNDVQSQVFQNSSDPLSTSGFSYDSSYGDKKYGDVILNEDLRIG
ncbi:MAG: hypothetical protein K8S14_02780 [Actinomycetia bacterium]|nr:hypothetical protein [Actinomycetes bacterium]